MERLCRNCKWFTYDAIPDIKNNNTLLLEKSECHYEPRPILTDPDNFCHNFESETPLDDYPM